MRLLSLNEVPLTLLYVMVALLFDTALCEIDVQIEKGSLKGQILKSRNGRPYYSFTGIPYAKPPIGELRFENPKPIDPWKGILDVTTIPRPCVQKEISYSGEDCLYLNVYTPNTNGDFPVMFWIHGGAFYLFHGGSDMFGPEYFMDKNVVLVSVNYRLGALGYLSTEDDVIPGNYGMKDQVMALRWVQENIVKFGGDPGRVTIFGGSSGGVNTGYHMLSPMSKGLFHKAILQSGTPLCRWSTSLLGVARNRSKIVSNIAGCSGETSEDILKCLKTLPAKFFADVYEKLREWYVYPNILFSPVVEQCNSGQEGFLCHHHLYNFKQVSFVPAIIGMNSAEGAMVTASLYNDTSLRFPELNADFNRLISIILSYQHFTLDLDVIGKSILKKYYPSGKIEDHSHLNTVEMITDGRYLHGIFDMAIKLSSPVYFYLFDYQNEFSYNTLIGNGICNKYLGVTHGDELTCFFKSKFVKPRELNIMDTKVSKRMVDIWLKFASSRIPTIDGTENGTAWPTFSLQNQRILHINSDHPSIIKNPFVEKYLFWNKLPLLSNLNNDINKNMFPSDFSKNEL